MIIRRSTALDLAKISNWIWKLNYFLLAMFQEGGSKYKAMAKYEYEAKSKSKHTETSGKAVVPVCLPVCCAMPCSIM